ATFGRVEQLNPLEEQTIFPSTTLFRSPAKAVMVAKGQPPLPLQAQGRYEAMLAELHDVGVATVDLRPALAEKEAWLRTDTHWSPRGASAAADLVAAALPGRWSEPGAGHAFAVTNHEIADFSGDLHSLLGLGRMAGIVGPRAEPVTGETFHFESDPGTDLFAEVSVDIALVG